MTPRHVWTLVVLSLGLWPVGPVAADEVPLGGPPCELVGHDKQITALAYAPDGKTLVSAGIDGDVRLWDPVPGKLRWVKRAHERGAYALAFSPDGKVLASAGADGVIRLWGPAAGDELQKLAGHQGAVAALAYSPNGKLLASGGYDGTIRLWDRATGGMICQLRGHEGRVTALTFFPDGKTLFSGGTIETAFRGRHFCGEADFIRVWDVATAKQLRRLEARGSTLALSAAHDTMVSGGHFLHVERSPDGSYLTGMQVIHFIDLRTGKQFRTITLRGEAASLSPDGNMLATAYGELSHLPGNIIGTGGPLAKKMDIQPCLWEMTTGMEILKYAEKSSVAVLAFSPDGKSLAAGSYDGKIRLWDLRAGPPEAVPVPAELKTADFERLWTQLGDQDPASGYHAVRTLAQRPSQAVALFGKRLRPIPPVDLERALAHIDELNAAEFTAREVAMHQLRKLGTAIEPALRQALARQPAPEASRRLESLVAELRHGQPGADELRAVRAIQVLEMIGSREARQLLQILANGAPLARQTQDAQAALGRLTRLGRE